MLAVAAAFLGTGTLKAQDIVVGGETGLSMIFGSPSTIALPIGAHVEWDINGSLSLLGRFSGDIGLGTGDPTIIYFNPEVRYYLSGSVFAGFYAGGFIGFGPATPGGSMVGVGGVIGYAIAVTEHFNLDITTQAGYGNWGTKGGRVSGFLLRPTVGFRYAF
jgi:hypothetical protein